MKNLKRIVSKNTEKLILFVAGVIVSSVISSLFEGIILWKDLFMNLSIVVLILAAVFFFSESTNRIRNYVNRIETTVKYVDEPYREQDGVQFKGKVYQELEKLLREAKSEVLTLSTASVDEGRGRLTDKHSSRASYFQTLENNIDKYKEKGFKYVRIQQVPLAEENSPISRYISEETANHFRRVINLERKISNEKVSIDIMKASTQRLTSFMIIDKRRIVFGVDGVDDNNRPYVAGMFVLEDKGDKLIQTFNRYFENLTRRSTLVSLDELGKGI